MSVGAYNAVSSSTYGSTTCSDHLVADAYGSGYDTWESVVAFNTSLTATTECECKDYELHVKLFGLGYGGQTCATGAVGATCVVVGDDCTGWACAWTGLLAPTSYQKRFVAQWSGGVCSVSGTITPSQAGLNGEDMQIQAAVIQGSTGNKQPVSIRLFD